MNKQRARLGFATTEELLREVISRLTAPNTTYGGTQDALLLAEMLGRMDALTREYRITNEQQ